MLRCLPHCEESSDTRRRSDQILKYIIIPALEPHGFDVTRADKLSEPGLITNQIISRLLSDTLVVGDLTDHNANVFYEIAIRQSAQKPLVLLISKGQRIPFDLAGFRTISYEITDLDSVSQAREELSKQAIVETAKPQELIESPISFAYQLHEFKKSSKSNDQYLAQLVEDVTEMKNRMSSIDSKLNYEIARINQPNLSHTALISEMERSIDRILDYALFDFQSSARTKKHFQDLLQGVLDELVQLRAKIRTSGG